MDLSDLDKVRPILAKFTVEGDRSKAILAGSLLDALLEQLLRSVFVEQPPEELFGPYGPLSSFAAKIDAAFALGLLSSAEYSDLHRHRKIRNEFAHSLNDTLSFDTSPISDHVQQLRLRRSTITGLSTTLALDYEASLLVLIGFLQGRISHSTHAQQPPDLAEALTAETRSKKGRKA